MKIAKNLSKEEKKLVTKMFWRSAPMYASVNPVTMGGGGFAYAMMPFINKFYKHSKDRADALKRHVQYFSTTIPLSSFVMGVAASMEKQNAETDDFDVDSINAIKTSLMGPLAGIGDSFFWGVWRVVCAGLAISLAQAGNVLAPIVFLVMFNIVNYLCRYYGAFLGYSLGSEYIKKLYANGMIEILTKAASILGLIMVGAMTVSMVKFHTTLSLSMKGTQVMNVQKVLDTIFKGMVPLLVTFGCFKLLRKNVSVIKLIVLIVILGIVLSLLHIV
ncbi:MAG: PTS system mannose/fructose/sorbose family transporter subunit IID [Lactobacillus sp.]|uniref:PTS mannose transporter subunit IID n=1 Tax=Bombilactobacillus bombi TaxID=1303590 RepID=A0A417ZHM1_9LACO|nr:PTS system mannose/fructose/sorbose family transporter subunit IID [Bombilactobacillus bombi]MCO6541118.1 PTS system mannose/fructose/sorbose family transporter subunit IID [Lactobacillus sp.]MCO6543378.1 PTS system mannose/fructose/sorbose family transporter subunit IID [Lactobacillus sp.]RHW51184.1 PTS mannose transporter subunit IID [Bombilactobacillus bombi]